MSNNLTVLSVEPVARTHSLKGLKAKQFTYKNVIENTQFKATITRSKAAELCILKCTFI